MRVGDRPSAEFFVIAGEKSEFIFELDGRSDPIHEANLQAGLKLDSILAAATYLKFFCYFVRGPEDIFDIVGIPECLAEDDDGFEFKAYVRYDKKMYESTFHIPMNGMVRMLDDIELGPTQ